MVPPLSEVDAWRLCHGRFDVMCEPCAEFESLATDGPHVVVLTDGGQTKPFLLQVHTRNAIIRHCYLGGVTGHLYLFPFITFTKNGSGGND
jgi:hypothetical protein